MSIIIAAQITQALTHRFWDGAVLHLVTVGAGDRYLTGLGGADDLIVALNAAAGMLPIAWSLAADGRVTCATLAGTSVRFLSADEPTRNLLGWRGTGALNLAAGGATAPYRSGWGLRLHHLAVSDLETEVQQTSVRLSDASSYAVHTGHRATRRIRIFYRGQPRSAAAADEQYGVRHLWRDSIGRGIPFRYYPDRTISAERDLHVPAGVPFGYQTYRLTSPFSFSPSQVVAGWGEYWQIDLEGVEL